MAKKTKMPTDVNQRAKAIVDLATSDEERSSTLVAVSTTSQKEPGSGSEDDVYSEDFAARTAAEERVTDWKVSRDDDADRDGKHAYA